MRSVEEIEKESRETTEKLYRTAFSKGLSRHYEDERTKGTLYYIQANPDGSEDLVSFDIATRSYAVIKNLLPPGKGRWAYLATKVAVHE